MMHIIITSYNEPKSTLRAVQTFLKQKPEGDFKIVVVDPFPAVKEFVQKKIKDKRIEFLLDPGEGKNYVMNLILQDFGSDDKNDFFIFSDGDVQVSKNSVSEIIKKFEDQKVGCVAGKPVSIDSRNTKYGFWANTLFLGVDKVRKKLSREERFFQCSGYLFAIRKGIVFDFPLNTAEDSAIPFLIWKKGYKIAYADKAEVYVKNPSNWEDWKSQKIRNVIGHETQNKVLKMPRTKSFFNEIREGALFALKQPKNFKEFVWTIQLYFARLYIYYKAFLELKKGKTHKDGWREKELKTTRPMD